MMAAVRGLAMGLLRGSAKKQIPPGFVAADTDTRCLHFAAEATATEPSTARKIRLLISIFIYSWAKCFILPRPVERIILPPNYSA